MSPHNSWHYPAFDVQTRLGDSARQTNPLMIRVDTKSGHGAGKPTSKSIEEYTGTALCLPFGSLYCTAADLFCFLVKSLGIEYRK